jgi:uncharacterized protein YijF (DUF1287 family)
MSKRKFNGSGRAQFAHHSEPEINNGPCLLEPGESMPLQFMIDRMMDAGVQKQVHAAMQKLYHFGPDGSIPDDFLDPFQDFGINHARVHELKTYLEAKIRQNKEAAAAALAKAKEENANDAIPSTPEGNGNGDPTENEPAPA